MSAIIVEAVRIWLWTGTGVAALFLFYGIDSCDEDADGAYAFRPLLIPGLLLVWPLAIWRWYRITTQTETWANRYMPPRAVHSVFAAGLALAVVALLLAGMLVRQEWPGDITPERLAVSEADQ